MMNNKKRLETLATKPRNTGQIVAEVVLVALVWGGALGCASDHGNTPAVADADLLEPSVDASSVDVDASSADVDLLDASVDALQLDASSVDADKPSTDLADDTPFDGLRCGDRCGLSASLCRDEIAGALAREFELDPASSSALFVSYTIGADDHGDPVITDTHSLDALNPCLGIEDPDLMNTQVFNVLDYGAIGDGAHHVLGDTALATFWDGERTCGYVGSAALEALEETLTRAFPATTVTSHWTDATVERRAYPAGFWATDEWDWVGIQSAIVAAHDAGGGTVIIPDTGAEYLSDRSIWVFSNVRVLWLTDPSRGQHSFVRMTERSPIAGGFFVSYNEFLAARNEGELYARHALNFVCRSRLIEPRLRTLPGENAIGYALGSYDVQIHGGVLEDATWGGPDELVSGFNEMGGKAIQFEAGVMHAVVRDTLIRDSAIGVNATTTFPIRGCSPACSDDEVELSTGGVCQCTARFAPTYFRAATHIDVANVTFERVQAPVSAFYMVLWSRYADLLVRASLERASPQSSLRFSNLTVREPTPWSGFIARPYDGAMAGEYSGVVNLSYATHVLVDGISLMGDGSWAQPLLRGSGRDITVRNVHSVVPLRVLLDGRFPYGRNGSYPYLESVAIDGVDAPGVTEAAVYLPAKPIDTYTVFLDTQLSHIALAEDYPAVYAGAVEDYAADELAFPNLSVE